MDFNDRLFYILLGSLIGFVAGYVVRTLQDIRDEMRSMNTNLRRDRNEDGLLRYPVFANTLLFLVVVLTAYSAWASQHASNEVERTQARISAITQCNNDILSATVAALNERTTYTRNQSDANVDLQMAQAETLRILLREPPSPELEQEAAAQEYFAALLRFVETSNKARANAERTDYPTVDQLQKCLVEGEEGEEEE